MIESSAPVTHDRLSVYRPDIDGLRALAVLAVIGYHTFPIWVTGGFTGVDVFFVISGFLISSIIFQSLDAGTFSLANFYARRIRRIFPALILVLASCLALGWHLLLTDEYIQLGKHTAGGAAFGPNFVLIKEAGYFDVTAESKPLLHLWSLGIEEQFYIVWPLLLLLLWRCMGKTLWVIAFLALGSFILNVYLVSDKPVQTFYFPLTRCWELLMGAVLAHLALYQKAPPVGPLRSILHTTARAKSLRHLQSAMGILLIFAGILATGKESIFPGWWALFPTIGTALVISAGPSAWFNRRVLAHPWLVFVGLISYPLYLWHWPLLSFLHIVSEGDPGPLQKTSIVLASIPLSWLTYRFWETPFRKSTQPSKIAALVILIAGVGISGRIVQKLDGYPERFPASIQNIVKFPYSYSHAKSYRSGKCFLDAKKRGADSFSEECIAPASSESKIVFLWGDSYAAHLYPGLKHHERENNFRVSQLTASGCPPILDAEMAKRPLCKLINDKVIQLIKSTAPDVVIMAANWKTDSHARRYTDLSALAGTIRTLREMGINEIVLVGPSPVWLTTAPKTLVKFAKDNNWQIPPDRLADGFVDETADLDATIEAFARNNGLSYVSPYKTFCNIAGCLAKIDGVPTTFDCCHLSDTASIFLIRSNSEKLRLANGPADRKARMGAAP